MCFLFRLYQLQGVSHARDKTLQEDRENRQRQMTQLQKDISNIPSEAVANLVGADYTLCKYLFSLCTTS